MLHDKDLLSIQEVRTKVEKAYQAWLKYRNYSQEQVDAIVEAMAAAARSEARRLAEWAVQETGYGNVESKIAKNLLCADLLARKIRPLKTVGVLREFPEEKIVEIGVPLGVIAAILPVTNPTSTAIYKILISLKAGNAVVIAPHPHAYGCTCGTAEVLYKAAIEAGAPEDIIQCVNASTIEGTNALMRHERTATILATGGHGIVRAAYSSGTPAYGVGPGNVPVLIERSADVKEAVAKVVIGKTFDFGTVCSSEQAIVAEESLREQVVAELKANRAFFVNDAQRDALARVLVTPNFTISSKCVGQAPTRIAKMAGFEVPAETSIIVCELKGVGREHPLSMEKLSPVLALYFAKDYAGAMDICEQLLHFGGLGHTAVIYSRDDARIRAFAMRMPAMRVMVNTPSPQGSTGGTTNLWPSMTLGCGAAAGNSTSDNIGPLHLINIKRLAYSVRETEPLPGRESGPGAGTVDRNAIVAAVERYLASRGIAAVPAAPEPVASTAGSIAAEVVESFLARRAKPAPAPATSSEPACKPGGG